MVQKSPAQQTLDRIIEWMADTTGMIVLTNDDKAIHDRFEYAYDHLRQQYPSADVVAFLMKKFNISRRTAYNDIDNAKYVHGEIGKPNLSYEIKNLLEVSTKNIQQAILDGNPKVLALAIEARVKVLKLIQEDTTFPWHLLERNQYVLNIYSAGKNYSFDLDKVDQISPTELKQVMESLDEHYDAVIEKSLFVNENNGHAGEEGPIS